MSFISVSLLTAQVSSYKQHTTAAVAIFNICSFNQISLLARQLSVFSFATIPGYKQKLAKRFAF
jgi:hypothetical protein